MREAVKEKVQIKIPVRADISGAFSDIAYYLDRYQIERGEVVNISLPVFLNITARIDEENANMVVDLPDLQAQIEGDVDELNKRDNDNVSRIIKHFIQLFDLDVSGLNIRVDGEGKIPPASGLGTSSAVGVGIISALSRLYGLYGINPCELNYLVELAMGVMGGKQDYYAAWVKGIGYYHFMGPGKSMVNLADYLDENSRQYEWFLERSMVYYSGVSRSSGVANSEPEKKVKSDPDILRRIAKEAGKSWRAIKTMDMDELQSTINQDRRNRTELSTIYYIDSMKKMGMIAQKMGYAHRACGAGMGGCMLFFGNSRNHSKLEKELKKLGGWRVC